MLEVQDLVVEIAGVPILRNISFKLAKGEAMGLVGESGCGKSMLGLTLMAMLPPTGRITSGRIILDGREIQGLKPKEMLSIRGSDLAMVMQDPFTSLNPVMRIGDQVAESFVLHQGLSWRNARTEAVAMLGHVGIPSPEDSARKFPHELSGGQRQRVVIAIAFSCRPKILIADEPTTALDVTLQAQILHLLRDLQREQETSVLLISHNIGVIASACETATVVYAGQFVETGATASLLRSPQHPYTQALLSAMPRESHDRLQALGGSPPDFANLGQECAFAPRCPHRFDQCKTTPPLIGTSHQVRCWLKKGSTS